jgi:hypothetical protein
VLIEGNYLNGGAFTVYSREKGHGDPTNVTITDNAFGRDYLFGILSEDGDLTWTDNYWADTGEYIDKKGHLIGEGTTTTCFHASCAWYQIHNRCLWLLRRLAVAPASARGVGYSTCPV